MEISPKMRLKTINSGNISIAQAGKDIKPQFQSRLVPETPVGLW